MKYDPDPVALCPKMLSPKLKYRTRRSEGRTPNKPIQIRRQVDNDGIMCFAPVAVCMYVRAKAYCPMSIDQLRTDDFCRML